MTAESTKNKTSIWKRFLMRNTSRNAVYIVLKYHRTVTTKPYKSSFRKKLSLIHQNMMAAQNLIRHYLKIIYFHNSNMYSVHWPIGFLQLSFGHYEINNSITSTSNISSIVITLIFHMWLYSSLYFPSLCA